MSKETTIATLAKTMGFTTTETRKSDRLDFRDVAVWSAVEALGNAFDAGASSSNRDPSGMPAASGPWRVAMDSTCSGAWPVILESCMDPETGATWDREIAQLQSTHVETQAARESSEMPGTFNTHPGNFELKGPGYEVDPEETFSIASTLAAAPVMLNALEAVLRSFDHAPGTGPAWFESCRQAHAMATTPYAQTNPL